MVKSLKMKDFMTCINPKELLPAMMFYKNVFTTKYALINERSKVSFQRKSILSANDIADMDT